MNAGEVQAQASLYMSFLYISQLSCNGFHIYTGKCFALICHKIYSSVGFLANPTEVGPRSGPISVRIRRTFLAQIFGRRPRDYENEGEDEACLPVTDHPISGYHYFFIS